MKPILTFFTALALLSLPCHALDLAQHAFFKHLIGDWKAEGELKGENSNVVTITETWTGKAETADGFSIEGTRTMNGDTQRFNWTITRNPATDSYEAVLTSADGQTIRFEGSVSDVTLVMDLKTITGNGNSSITVQDSFAEGSKDTINSKVTFTGDQGQTTLEGTIIHKRVKAP